MRAEAAEAFNLMHDAAAEDGIDFVMTTAYRTYAFQNVLWTQNAAAKGEEEANKAQAQARSLFGAGSGDDAPEVKLSAEDLVDGKLDIQGVLVKAGMCASRSEARRVVEQGGVMVDGEKVGLEATYDASALAGGILVKKGKKVFKKVIM